MNETVLVLTEFGSGYGLVLLSFLIGYIGGNVLKMIRMGESAHD